MHCADEVGCKDEGTLQDRNRQQVVELAFSNGLGELEIATGNLVRAKENFDCLATDFGHLLLLLIVRFRADFGAIKGAGKARSIAWFEEIAPHQMKMLRLLHFPASRFHIA